jgi:hypothetical protein
MPQDDFKPLFGGNEDTAKPDDSRRYARLPARSAVTIYDGERRRQGHVRDISGSGALLAMDSELETLDEPPEEGRYIDMDIEDVSYLGGQVVRHLDDGFAVRFDMDDDECRNLADEIISQQLSMSE